MAGADVAPSSGVGGGMGAVLRGYREEKARQFGDAASNASSGDVGMDISRMNWGQRRFYMKNQEAFEGMRQQRRADAMQDMRNATVLDTAAEVYKGREASKVKKGEERQTAKLGQQALDNEAVRKQKETTSQRIYETTQKQEDFGREKQRRNQIFRQATKLGGPGNVESISFAGTPGTGGKGGGGASGDTIKFSVT